MKSMAQKLSKTIGILSYCRKYLSFTTLKLLYNSLFVPHINYGILSWGSDHASGEFNRIYKLQKWAIRLISGNPKRSHHLPICKSLHLLTLVDIFHFRCFKLLKSWQLNTLPTSFQRYFSTVANSGRRSHRFRENLLIPKSYLKSAEY